MQTTRTVLASFNFYVNTVKVLSNVYGSKPVRAHMLANNITHGFMVRDDGAQYNVVIKNGRFYSTFAGR